MKRILLTVVTASALALTLLFAGSAQAHGPGGYRCGPGGYGVAVGYGGYGGYGYGSGVNIALRTTNIARVVPNVAYSSGFAGGYGYGCNRCYVPYGAGYIGGYQPYQQFGQRGVGFYYGY